MLKYLHLSVLKGVFYTLESDCLGQDTPGNRQTKLYVQLLSIENQLATICSGNSAAFQVTKDLEVRSLSKSAADGLSSIQRNLKDYAVAVLLSTHISAYKGNVPKDHLLVGVLDSCDTLP